MIVDSSLIVKILAFFGDFLFKLDPWTKSSAVSNKD